MLISEALNLKEKAFISLVGAGGKSTLFSRLAEELAHKNKRTILTTTTKMFSWQLIPLIKKGRLIEGRDEETIRECIEKYFSLERKGGRLAVIGEKIEDNGEEKVAGNSFIDYRFSWGNWYRCPGSLFAGRKCFSFRDFFPTNRIKIRRKDWDRSFNPFNLSS